MFGCLGDAAKSPTAPVHSGTVFLGELNDMDPFTAALIKRAVILVGCIFVILFVERIGRRRLCLIVGSMCAASLMIMGGLGTITPKQTDVSKGILAMTILFPMFYTIGFGSTMQIVKLELPHTSLRDKSVMTHWSAANVCNFLTTFNLPYLLLTPGANLAPKVGFIYGGISVIIIVLMFFFMPGMTNRSLEEIDEMMEAKVRAWRTRDRPIRTMITWLSQLLIQPPYRLEVVWLGVETNRSQQW
ncbi:hypothetical protein FZEAL_4077 [Fusarium zealandicum]|uniref:Major facilitator superfamily (MFS) profile domain-containing protein n=1 Tax=Fusarium zealandicum TaxID=1053134 RepID=A0A8H4XLY2_9HYPO|nr:hypothetical protein FZEAL_4077 [Fusarium zealandicum]